MENWTGSDFAKGDDLNTNPGVISGRKAPVKRKSASGALIILVLFVAVVAAIAYAMTRPDERKEAFVQEAISACRMADMLPPPTSDQFRRKVEKVEEAFSQCEQNGDDAFVEKGEQIINILREAGTYARLKLEADLAGLNEYERIDAMSNLAGHRDPEISKGIAKVRKLIEEIR